MHAESDDSFGFYTGNKKDSQAKCVSPQQTIARDQLVLIWPQRIRFYVVDEVHRAGSACLPAGLTKPKFLLSLTATPERTDGYNLYELFDYNIAYESACKMLLKPIYQPITLGWWLRKRRRIDFWNRRTLILDERVDYVMDKLTHYGLDKDKVKGLVFNLAATRSKVPIRQIQRPWL